MQVQWWVCNRLQRLTNTKTRNLYKTLKLKEERRTQNNSLMISVALISRKQLNKCSLKRPERACWVFELLMVLKKILNNRGTVCKAGSMTKIWGVNGNFFCKYREYLFYKDNICIHTHLTIIEPICYLSTWNKPKIKATYLQLIRFKLLAHRLTYKLSFDCQ